MRRIYFAHPVNLYGEPLEDAIEKLIAETVCGGDRSFIENPNQPHHQEGYRAWAARAKESSTKHRGMNYFFDEVLPECDECVLLPFLDGRLGLGVASEGKWFLERSRIVWIIEHNQPPAPEDIEEFILNPLNGFFYVRFTMPNEVMRVLIEDPQLVVPHEETRLRTWRVYNRKKRPYEEAHLVKMPIPEGFYPQDNS